MAGAEEAGFVADVAVVTVTVAGGGKWRSPGFEGSAFFAATAAMAAASSAAGFGSVGGGGRLLGVAVALPVEDGAVVARTALGASIGCGGSWGRSAKNPTVKETATAAIPMTTISAVGKLFFGGRFPLFQNALTGC